MPFSTQRIYELVYQHKNLLDPWRKTPLGPYASHDHRDVLFIEWIQKQFPADSKILDASCGRGHLALRLRELGYQVEGTEFCKWIIDNELVNFNFPVYNLSYEELDQLPEKSYDCVCSNDVMEHLPSDKSATLAVKNLCRLSRKGICFAISSGKRSFKYSQALLVKRKLDYGYNLHTFVKEPKWWKILLQKYIDTKYGIDIATKKHLYYFGFVK